jgi:drug/metabolite transporter (DMT)-like permease
MSNTLRIALFTTFALFCFAGNSVLNRLALGSDSIDAGSYIGIRLMSGAVALWLMNGAAKRDFSVPLRGSFLPAFYLFLYGVAFSFAYRSLTSGTGAFILFGTVQATMLSVAIFKGERPHFSEWIGLLFAISGLLYLVFPGLSAPDPLGAALMVTAGVAWGGYTLKGKGVQNPLETTALNFMRAVPMVLLVNLFTFSSGHWSGMGVFYAILSGAVTSGIGYAVWYAALKGLTTTQAALLQLCVPVIAALGGVVLMSESVTMRLFFAGLLIISGVSLALLGKRYF